MQAKAVTQAITVAPATSNSKDDSISNIMTAHNSENARNSRNERDNRTVWMLKIRDDSNSRDNSIIMDVISGMTARIDSREDSNIHHEHQQQ